MPLEGVEPLLTLAEVGLGLSGFAAIILVLTKRLDSVPTETALTFRYMVLNALFPAVFVFLPLIFFGLGFGSSSWRYSAFSVCLVQTVVVWPTAIIMHRAAKAPISTVSAKTIFGIGWVIAVLAFLVQAGSILGYPQPSSAGTFLLGLWLWIVLAAFQFLQLLFGLLR